MAILSGMSFEIAKCTGVCAASGKKIEPGDKYIAALVEREGDESLERLDYSHGEWKRGSRPARPLKLFASWTTTMPTGKSKKQALIDDEALVELLDQLDGVEEPKRVSFRYVLALLLIRKRVLKYEETRRDHTGGRPVMVVKRATGMRAAGSAEWEVVDPGMDEQAIADAIEQVGGVMSGSVSEAK